MRSGDHVYHKPSEETWVVAWADHETGYMAPCGWPTCEALIADCEMVKEASDDECAEIIERVQKSGRTDAHKPAVIQARTAIRPYESPLDMMVDATKEDLAETRARTLTGDTK